MVTTKPVWKVSYLFSPNSCIVFEVYVMLSFGTEMQAEVRLHWLLLLLQHVAANNIITYMFDANL